MPLGISVSCVCTVLLEREAVGSWLQHGKTIPRSGSPILDFYGEDSRRRGSREVPFGSRWSRDGKKFTLLWLAGLLIWIPTIHQMIHRPLDSDTYNLVAIFRDLFVRESFQYDYIFDWTVYKYQKNAQAIAQVAGNQAQAAAEEKPGRRHAATNAATGAPTPQHNSTAGKPAAISNSRRKVVERGASGTDNPQGGSDRM